jgi:hypothetical protein
MNRRRSGRSFNYRKHQGGWVWNAISSALNSEWLWKGLDVAASLYGQSQAKDAAKDAAKVGSAAEAAQSRALDAQTQMALVNNARGQEMYDEYMDTALPAKREVLEMASQHIDPNVEAAQAGADYALADAVQSGTRRRNLARNGVDPSSGAAIESERLAALDSVAGRAAASTTARRGASDKRFDRMGRAADQFQGLIGGSSSFTSQANNALGTTAAAYGNRAAQAAQIASAAGESQGESLSDILGVVQDMWKGRGGGTTTQEPTKPVVNFVGPR